MKALFSDGESDVDWGKFGRKSLELLQRAPIGAFMLGAVDAGCTVKRKETKARERYERPTHESQIHNLGTQMSENERPDNAHEAQIASIKTCLDVHTKHEPVELYRFVLNPSSFSQTVENLFALGFLVKENMASHKIDENGRQLIGSLSPEQANAADAPARVACILRFEYGDFEKWCKMYADEEQMVPTRDE